jgi:hypothetical protein
MNQAVRKKGSIANKNYVRFCLEKVFQKINYKIVQID